MKSIKKLFLLSGIMVVIFFICSCGKTNDTQDKKEDTEAKKTLQGVWINDLEGGNTVFSIKGDSIFFNDSLSSPTTFFVRNDTLIIEYHKQVCYPIKSLTSSSLTFINGDGDEVELTKFSASFSRSKNKYVVPNQGKIIKNDSILVFGTKHYHAYTQVNPTTYKVYHQSTNNDGLNVESIYFNNIVYIALFDGAKKLFGQNFEKKDFSKYVPDSYLSEAILSDITIDSTISNGVRFVAILSIPDSYTTYRVNIDISYDGKKKLSVNN